MELKDTALRFLEVETVQNPLHGVESDSLLRLVYFALPNPLHGVERTLARMPLIVSSSSRIHYMELKDCARPTPITRVR